MRHAYFVDYGGRDFCNVYSVMVVKIGEAKEYASMFPDAERITRREAIRLGWTRPKEAKRDGEQWFGGFQTRYFSATLEETIADCLETTRGLMAEQRTMAEYR
jgi:hypothetical protein